MSSKLTCILATVVTGSLLPTVTSADSVIPAFAEYDFSAKSSAASKDTTELPPWAGPLRSADGEVDASGYWRAASDLPSGTGKLVVDLDRKLLTQDLALSLTYQSTSGTDFSVQLLDGDDKTVAVDLFQNVVALGKDAQTDTFIVPLRSYPNAAKLAIRRVTGDLRIRGFVLYPVVGEIKADIQSHAALASLFGDPLSDRNSLQDALATFVPKDAVKAGKLQEKLSTIPGAPAIDFSRVTQAAHGVLLSSKDGEAFCGHQLEFFRRHRDGSLTCSEPEWINLYRTEGKSFRLSGEVMLTAKSTLRDAPHGFALFLREFDSLHRYNANSVGMRVKRRLLEGERIKQFARPFAFKPLPPGQWHPFSAEVRPDFISFSLGKQVGMMKGPLATNGANKIVLTPEARLRNLRLKILP